MKFSARSSILLFLLSLCFSPKTYAQLDRIRTSLGPNVEVITANDERMVLLHTQRRDSIVITLNKEDVSDIYGTLEQRRGSNPYRVWWISERLTRRFANPTVELQEFFRRGFLDALETPASRDEKTSEIETEPLPESTDNLMADKGAGMPALRVARDLDGKQETSRRNPFTTPESAPNPPAFRPKLDIPEILPKSEEIPDIELRYRRGIEAFGEKNWREAIAAFSDVLDIDPDYQDAAAKLQEANQALIRSRELGQLKTYYFQGIRAIQDEDFRLASEAFGKVREIDPDFQNAEALYRHAIEMISLRSADPVLSQVKVQREVMLDSLYQEGLRQKFNDKPTSALVTFSRIQSIEPNYRDVRAEIEDLGDIIEQREKYSDEAVLHETGEYSTVETSASSKLMIAAVAALLILPALGVLLMAPSNRARFALMTGNPERAGSIYESMLIKQPHNLLLYSKIASIYLMSNRTDEKAIQVYKKVLDLRLAVKNDYGKLFAILKNYNVKQLGPP